MNIMHVHIEVTLNLKIGSCYHYILKDILSFKTKTGVADCVISLALTLILACLCGRCLPNHPLGVYPHDFDVCFLPCLWLHAGKNKS